MYRPLPVFTRREGNPGARVTPALAQLLLLFIIIFKVFSHEIVLVDTIWSWWGPVYQEFKDVFEENK